jgi:hypothetical protein
MVERAAVNRDVEGSSPSSGAIFKSLMFNDSFSRKVQKGAVCQKKCQKKFRRDTIRQHSDTIRQNSPATL